MEKLQDLKYGIKWRFKQLKAKIRGKEVAGYKRVLTLKEIIKGGK